jgi:hypothetical protein
MPKLSVIALFLLIIITTTPILTQDPNTTPGHWRDWVNEINIGRDRTGPALSTNETDAILDRHHSDRRNHTQHPRLSANRSVSKSNRSAE